MSDVPVLIHTAVAIVATVVLIVRFRVNPVISLVLGSLYLGLTTKLGLDKTVQTITKGFGDIMAEVGLLIAFGVLMGAILQEMGTIEQLVHRLIRVFGPKRLPYSMSLTIGTLLQSIYLDVLLVISAPLARSASQRIGPLGTPRMAVAMAIGLECGIVLVVPGVGALALAALLHVPLGTMLLWGLLLIIPTIVISVAIMTFLFRKGFWNAATDETAETRRAHTEADTDTQTEQLLPAEQHSSVCSAGTAEGSGVPAATATLQKTADGEDAHADKPRPEAGAPHLLLSFAPLLLALLMIAAGAITDAADLHNRVLAFLADPVVALLAGLIGTVVIGRIHMGQKRVEDAIARGFKDSGQILILTAVGGSLAAVVAAGGLGDILRGYFGAHSFAPLLLVWAIAAVLHIAVGSVTISAITAAGILAPLAPSLGIDPVLIALAAGTGSLFAVHVTSNTFWLLQSLMGQTTRGTLKTCTAGVSLASVVAIILLQPISLLFF
ncbi:H+/gluconate symporter-like permease [Streptomyces umbrinus]|uniref:GntP family permease n=1 Tax=Streptomyces umbrinus TaxID=67370 RepID=UPI00167DA8AF|nr:SLC13 family permease [Streptomyces umbrinus]MCR3731894.1 H+/gluconate symporter-like permease [Streptomyces umbrinus]GHH66350.1 gluconate permease [Streptomyces umbrinus]